MKLDKQVKDVDVSGMKRTEEYRIKTTGKAFQLLIDGLYSNKEESIIRELCTNAYDSHRIRGNLSEPFEVHTPHKLNPVFYVRDFGVGMTEADIFQVYSTIFESTKDDTDDQVGCYGLGSKTPFAYTDVFTVQAYTGESCSVYSANINSEGVPQISLIDTFPSEEEQGIQVSLPVKEEDFSSFSTEFLKVMRGFDCAPVSKGAVTQERLEFHLDTEIGMVGKNWWTSPASNQGGMWVRQGCVLYPLDKHAFRESKEVFDIWQYLTASNLTIDVPIGSVETSASRESLAYTPKTVSNVLGVLREVIKSVNKFVEDSLKECPTKWERTVLAKDLSTSSSYSTELITYVVRKVHKTSLSYNPRMYDVSIMTLRANQFMRTNKTFNGISSYKGRTSSKFHARDMASSAYHRTVSAYKETLFLVDIESEKVKYKSARIGGYVRELRENHQYDFSVVWIRSDSMLKVRKLLATLGHPPYVKLSDLPDIIPESRPSSKASIWEWDWAEWGLEKVIFEEEEVDEDDEDEVPSQTIYYVPVKSLEVQHGGSTIFPKSGISDFIYMLKDLTDFKHGDTIWFIAASLSVNVAEYGTPVNAVDMLYDKLKSIPTSEILTKVLKRDGFPEWIRNLLAYEKCNKYLKDTYVYKLHEKLQGTSDAEWAGIDAVKSCMRKMGIWGNHDEKVSEYLEKKKDAEKLLTDTIPLCTVFFKDYDGYFTKHKDWDVSENVKAYVKMCMENQDKLKGDTQ